MRIVVIDGQGGGIGKALCQELKKRCPHFQIIAVGTNSIATAAMLKAGADQGAMGENAVKVCAKDADVILGPIGIILADAMLGEITPKMAKHVAKSPARKILIPVKRCQITIVGMVDMPVTGAIALAVDEVVAMSGANV